MYHMFIVSLMNYLFQRVVPTFQLSNNCLCIITQGNNQVVSDKGHDKCRTITHIPTLFLSFRFFGSLHTKLREISTQAELPAELPILLSKIT